MDIHHFQLAFDNATKVAGILLNIYSILLLAASIGLDPVGIFPSAFIVGLVFTAIGYGIAFIKGQSIDLEALTWDFILLALSVWVTWNSASEKEGLRYKLFSIVVFLLTLSTALFRLGLGDSVERIFYSIVNDIFRVIADSGLLGIGIGLFLLWFAFRLMFGRFF